MSRDHDFRKLLREPTAELVRSLRHDEEWLDFLADRRPRIEISGLGPLINEYYAGVETPSPEYWNGVTLLSNWAPTPVHIDGELFACVETFFHALKFEEGSSERAFVAAVDGPSAQHYARRKRGRTFRWRGMEVAVGSPEHQALVAEAIASKVREHNAVKQVLLATGRARLRFPYSGTRNALGQATPLALMIERAKLGVGR
ncbi:MAG TPA: hypothetical protein VEK57_09220 [Thermoanaerobaculia bacterium]|nr:hypothetical protein [Thermoanaerobaculia bacterium]